MPNANLLTILRTLFQVSLESIHGNPDTVSFVAVDAVDFLDTENCEFAPMEAVPSLTTTTTTAVSTLPPDSIKLRTFPWDSFYNQIILQNSSDPM